MDIKQFLENEEYAPNSKSFSKAKRRIESLKENISKDGLFGNQKIEWSKKINE